MQPPIRIVIFIEARTISGSVKPVLEFACQASREAVFVISFLTFARNENDNALIQSVREQGFEIDLVQESFPFDPRILPQLKAAMRRRKPDYVWTNSVKSHFLVRMAGLHKLARWVAFHHGYTSTSWKTLLYNKLDLWSHPAAARVVTVCDHFADLLERQGVRRERIRVQHSPIRRSGAVSSSEAGALRQEMGIADGEPVLLSVGRLSREKGHAELLQAMPAVKERFPSLRLVLVGDGPEQAALEKIQEALGLQKNVLFAGYRSVVRPFYAISDVFVLPSHSEGSPNVLLEAMDAGVPVVATAVGGVSEIVTDEVSALLVPGRSPDRLASAIIRLLENAELRRRLIEHAEAALSHHTPEHYFSGISAVFEELSGRA